MDANFWLQLAVAALGAAASAVGVYAAIRADLTRAIVLAETAQTSASEAHSRIDTLLQHN